MADSKELKENTNFSENGAPENKEVLQGRVITILNESVTGSFTTGDNSFDVEIPISKFDGDVHLGDTIEVVFTETDGKRVVVNAKPINKISETNTFNKKGKVVGYNFVTDEVKVEFLDVDETIYFTLKKILPNSKFEGDITVHTILNVKLNEENGIYTVIGAEIMPEETETTEIEENEETSMKKDEILLEYIDKDFLLECMSVPTYSKSEYRMVMFVMLWAIRNKIKYEFDSFGNIYLTKGELKEGEYYPCVTSHLDTVQSKQAPYVYASVPLKLKIETTEHHQHKLYVDDENETLGKNIGIGADDKGGICICLSLFNHLDKLKACFFLDEESGCNGSNNLDEEWFKDVGYVIGYDSPDLYRAAWACQGTKLFNYEFYEKYMKEVCDYWGLTEGCFFSEPYTDVKNIREKIQIICMNFGNGGYYAHNIGGTEYCVMEDMDQACGMGISLIEHIGLTKHYLKHTNSIWSSNCSYIRLEDGTFIQDNSENEDNDKLKLLGDTKRTKKTTSTQVNYTPKKSNTNGIKPETVQYIVKQYDTYLDGIKEELTINIKELCDKNGVDFEQFEKIISNSFSNEIKF